MLGVLILFVPLHRKNYAYDNEKAAALSDREEQLGSPSDHFSALRHRIIGRIYTFI